MPPLARVFGLAPLSFAEWRLLLFFPPAMILLDEAHKWIARRRHTTRKLGVESAARRRDGGVLTLHPRGR